MTNKSDIDDWQLMCLTSPAYFICVNGKCDHGPWNTSRNTFTLHFTTYEPNLVIYVLRGYKRNCSLCKSVSEFEINGENRTRLVKLVA